MLLLIVTGVVLLLLIAYGIWWFLFARHYESTDDAYVAGNVVQITPQVGGTVIAIRTNGLVDCDVWLKTRGGTTMLSGMATVAFPDNGTA